MFSSDMLEKAIVDASVLKEIALKNAENVLTEKYSEKIREAVEKILEQSIEDEDENEDENDLDVSGDLEDIPSSDSEGMMDIEGGENNKSDIEKNIPLAASEGEKLCVCPEDDEEIEIDFSELAKQIKDDSLSDDDMLDREETMEELPMDNIEDEEEDDLMKESNNFDEDEIDESEQINLDEIDLQEILSSKINFDVEPAVDGWLGSSPVEKQEMSDLTKASDMLNKDKEADETNETDEANEENKENIIQNLLKYIEKLKKENNNFKKVVKENNNLKKVVKENKEIKLLLNELKNTLYKVNIKNIRLFYKNKALNSVSLNERQKKQIVEAINKVDSLKQAELVFETLQNSVGTHLNKKVPKSLREAVEKSSSALFKQKNYMQQNEENFQNINPRLDRLKILAGIKIKKNKEN